MASPVAPTPDVKAQSKFWQMIADLPSTNFRIFVGVCLSALYVVVVLAGVVTARIHEADHEALYIVGAFILLQMGIDVAQFKFKRDSYKPGDT